MLLQPRLSLYAAPGRGAFVCSRPVPQICRYKRPVVSAINAFSATEDATAPYSDVDEPNAAPKAPRRRDGLTRQDYDDRQKKLEELRDAGTTFTARIKQPVSAGVLVEWEQIVGLIPTRLFGPELEGKDLESLVGTEIPVTCAEVSRALKRNGPRRYTVLRFVFRNKPLDEPVLSKYSRGQLVSGTVGNIVKYGAFVNLDEECYGLLHTSRISQQSVQDATKLFKHGEQVKAVIVNIEDVTGKITLSTKVLEPTPGDMLSDRSAVFEHAEETLANVGEDLILE